MSSSTNSSNISSLENSTLEIPMYKPKYVNKVNDNLGYVIDTYLGNDSKYMDLDDDIDTSKNITEKSSLGKRKRDNDDDSDIEKNKRIKYNEVVNTINKLKKKLKNFKQNVKILSDIDGMIEQLLNIKKNLESFEDKLQEHQSKNNIQSDPKLDEIDEDVINDFIIPKLLDEPLLSEDNQQFTVYPLRFNEIFNAYKKQLASFWVVEEVDLTKDVKDWDNLSNDEKFFISMILAFFAGSDGLVNMNLIERFLKDVKAMEARMAYSYQAAMENIHGEMYSLMIDTYIKDQKVKAKLFNAIKTVPCIKKKADWAMKWINSKKSFSHRVVAFAIVEGVFFSGSFCSIFWLRSRGLLPGLSKSNEFIARDEGMHTDFACLLYSLLNNKLKETVVYQIMDEAIAIEKEFICESLPCKLIGMNSTLMSQYIEFVADRLLVELGYNKKYNATNPFPFMEKISLQNKTNFFEARPTDYQKVMNQSHDIKDCFNKKEF
jgi:ribonucleoside-diphosphate reductase subunit M2